MRLAALFVCLVGVSMALGASQGLTSDDRSRLQALFSSAEASKDLQSASAAAAGLAALGAPIPQSACKLAQSTDGSLNNLYYAARIATLSGNCQVSHSGAKAAVDGALASSEAASIHRAVVVAKALNVPITASAVVKKLKEITDGEYTVSAAGHIFSAAAALGDSVSKSELAPFVDLIEDVVNQAESTDTTLSFEGGLQTTALILRGAYELAALNGEAPNISDKQVLQFVTYLASGKFTHDLSAASALAVGLAVFAKNPFHKPVVVTADTAAVSSKNRSFKVQVANVLGGFAAPLTVVATQVKDSKFAVVLKDKTFTPLSADSTTYVLDLSDAKLKRGVYSVTVSAKAASEGDKFIFASATVSARVVDPITVTDAKVDVISGSSVAKTASPSYPASFSETLAVSSNQRVAVTFKVKNTASSEYITVRQAFVRFAHTTTKAEVTFLAEAADDNTYSLKLDVGKKSKEFESLSGVYNLELVLGDVTAEKGIEWTLGKVSLTFDGASTAGAHKPSRYEPLPGIEHVFRQPEARPPVFVSMVFTALTLAPVALLLILWVSLGANISRFSFSPVALLYHLGIGAILLLYVVYFLRINMFQTLQYLVPIGLVTFLAGQSTLSSLVAKKNK